MYQKFNDDEHVQHWLLKCILLDRKGYKFLDDAAENFTTDTADVDCKISSD